MILAPARPRLVRSFEWSDILDATFLLLGATLLAGAVLLSMSVEGLMRRLGVRPADPADRSRGFGDVVQRLKQWSRSRQRSSDDRK